MIPAVEVRITVKIEPNLPVELAPTPGDLDPNFDKVYFGYNLNNPFILIGEKTTMYDICRYWFILHFGITYSMNNGSSQSYVIRAIYRYIIIL